jgi:hypothetical protein
MDQTPIQIELKHISTSNILISHINLFNTIQTPTLSSLSSPYQYLHLKTPTPQQNTPLI